MIKRNSKGQFVKGSSAPKTAFKKGQVPWIKGKHHSVKTVKKITDAANNNKRYGKNNHIWKGNDAGYLAIHTWVRRHKGIPVKCEFCGKRKTTPKGIHWANIDHTYRRNLDDYIALCSRCHKKYDLLNGLCKH
uniref:Uncharacterized protein n=1 Tax=viral metagenome TaxID=1070528 RepID=A0A6H1ZXV8_9ZZZZ